MVDERWFSRLSDEGFASYEKLANIVLRTNNAWDKVFAGVYSDDLVLLIALLTLIDENDSNEELSHIADECPERLNTMACRMLEAHYGRIAAKPIDGFNAFEDPLISNVPALPLRKGTVQYDVLSTGLDNVGTPLILVDTGRRAVCFRLPDDLQGWACGLASLAGTDLNVLPSNVLFTTTNDADTLRDIHPRTRPQPRKASYVHGSTTCALPREVSIEWPDSIKARTEVLTVGGS